MANIRQVANDRAPALACFQPQNKLTCTTDTESGFIQISTLCIALKNLIGVSNATSQSAVH